MEQFPKYAKVMSVIQRRIDKGDYLLRTIPGERRIAEETGVSYMTARRAVIELVKKKVLIRRPNGALEAHPDYSKGGKGSNIALLSPSYPSPHIARMCWIVESAMKERDVKVRPVHYVHWDDPVVFEALSQTDGTFVVPTADNIPARVSDMMRESKVVILDGDFSAKGIPSIQLFPGAHIEKIFARLTNLGHRRIDCVNAQHDNPEIDRRIALWRKWLADHHLTGKLWSNPAPSFSDSTEYAYNMMRDVVASRKINATAIVGTTYPSTVATIRALWEKGWKIGQDISVCTMNVEHMSNYFCPAVTGLEIPDLSEVLSRCFDWFAASGKWRGPLLLEPSGPRLFEGESCGPAPKHL